MMVPLRGIPGEISVAEASSLFPGFRFSPTDDELIQYYLRRKLQGSSDHGIEVIAEVEITKFEPWELPDQAAIHSDHEWFFFSPRSRKYPNGTQSKRATNSGYWKATGKERIMRSGSTIIGTKRTLVFHSGRAPRGHRTEWIMNEYSACDKSQDSMVICRIRTNSDFSSNHQDTPSLETNSSEISAMSNPVSDDKHSIVNKKNSEEDDCYAEIMEDDIIKLDDSTLSEPRITLKPRSAAAAAPSVRPLQGTVNHRIRLHKLRSRSLSGKLLRSPSHCQMAKGSAANKWMVMMMMIMGFSVFVASGLVVSIFGDLRAHMVKNFEAFSRSYHEMKEKKSC